MECTLEERNVYVENKAITSKTIVSCCWKQWHQPKMDIAICHTQYVFGRFSTQRESGKTTKAKNYRWYLLYAIPMATVHAKQQGEQNKQMPKTVLNSNFRFSKPKYSTLHGVNWSTFLISWYVEHTYLFFKIRYWNL